MCFFSRLAGVCTGVCIGRIATQKGNGRMIVASIPTLQSLTNTMIKADELT